MTWITIISDTAWFRSMTWITIISDTAWFRFHPVWSDANGRALYPSWRASFAVARIIASV